MYRDAAADQPNDASKNADQTHEACSSSSSCAIGAKWTPLRLLSIEPYNHDTSLFEFELPQVSSDNNNDDDDDKRTMMMKKTKLNLPITAHLWVRAPGREHGSGGDAVRPYTSVSDPHTDNGSFRIMVKRYREWGIPEEKQRQQHKIFLFTKTDHSYKPPGAVSTYIHELRVGDTLEFRFQQPQCLGRIQYPFPSDVTAITMIAVGAGVAPMIRVLRELLRRNKDNGDGPQPRTIRLLYGVRTVSDILLRPLLDEWHDTSIQDSSDNNNDDQNSSSSSTPSFRVMYCVGSRFANVHFAAKTKKAEGPPPPVDYEEMPSDRKCLGWVDGAKVLRYGASTPNDPGHRVFVCGLPGVYWNLVGPRSDPELSPDCELHKLGFQSNQIVKF